MPVATAKLRPSGKGQILLTIGCFLQGRFFWEDTNKIFNLFPGIPQELTASLLQHPARGDAGGLPVLKHSISYTLSIFLGAHPFHVNSPSWKFLCGREQVPVLVGFGGVRLLLGVSGDLIIPVLCVFLRIMALLRQGSPRIGGNFPNKSCPELGTAKGFSLPSLQGVKTHLVVQLPGARERFCYVCMAAEAQKETPPFFFGEKLF